MMSKEYCRYIRTYSELEGLQHAHTLVYCGAAAAQGVVMELRQEQDGRVRRSAVLLQDSLPGQCSCCATCVKTASGWSSGWTFWTMQARVMNCWKMQAWPGRFPTLPGKTWIFVPYAGFELQILLQITQLTHERGEFIL